MSFRRSATIKRPDTEGWLLPAGHRHHAQSTLVGTVDGAEPALVDSRGLLTPGGAAGTWSLDWWVGGDDRWHLPSASTTVRQRLIDNTPVVETSMRVPAGDALHRVYGARGPSHSGGDQYLIVEIENASPVPFALALAIRPFGQQAIGQISSIDRVDIDGGRSRDQAQAVLIDGAPVLLFPKTPAVSVSGSSDFGDVVEQVTTGGATTTFSPVHDPGGMATVAFVFPLAHHTMLRFAIAVDARSGGDPSAYPDTLPDAERVANGWSLQTRDCPRIEVPDTGLSAGIAASRCTMLLADPTSYNLSESALLVAALDRDGLHREANRHLVCWPDLLAERRPERAVASAALAAVVEHWVLSRDDALASALLGEIAALARLSKGQNNGPTLAGLAQLMDALGQPDAASDIRATDERVEEPLEAVAAWNAVRDASKAASATWAFPDGPLGAARFLAAMHRVLIHQGVDSLEALPVGVGNWWGQGIEVHNAPTAHGLLSFAMRWHGERPAILWELQPLEGAAPVRLSAPILDRDWQTTDARGDALLAVVPTPEGWEKPEPSVIESGTGKAESVAPRSVLPMPEVRRRSSSSTEIEEPPTSPGGSFS